MKISKKFHQKHLVPLFAAIEETHPTNRPLSTAVAYQDRLEIDLQTLEKRCELVRTLAIDLQAQSHVARAAKKTKKKHAYKHAKHIPQVPTKDDGVAENTERAGEEVRATGPAETVA